MLPGEVLLTDAAFASSRTWGHGEEYDIRYLWDFTDESSLEGKKKGTTHAERIQTQANRVLTNRLQFPAGRSVVRVDVKEHLRSLSYVV